MMEEKSWVNGARPHILKEHDFTPKGVKIDPWEVKPALPQKQKNKKTTSFYVCNTSMHALHKQIYGISIVLKPSRGAIREKYLEWLLRGMVMEKGRETLLHFLWFIWANSGFWWSDGFMKLKW